MMEYREIYITTNSKIIMTNKSKELLIKSIKQLLHIVIERRASNLGTSREHFGYIGDDIEKGSDGI